ncbi:glycoside hydrolase family 3 C-terminal domain-containing protein [Streptomyces sp. PSKA54]|uniref:Glycoside hydrolase family 3 C-terminal domain-containing protein n=1 Tax=Streptomyces himalayensis subsp. aureolus TaxID=2758039 RepID=A0A7W2HEI5_9ACTN|nr:glycoside hydrolase family 3 C-terminal domain-containing protein [Streptomyces himalayensis subsp. aureolus]
MWCGGPVAGHSAVRRRPFVVVLTCGRPLALGSWLASAPAVLVAWHPGLESGHAIADVVFKPP